LANARIAVLTQNVLDQRREPLAKNFEGSCLGDERNFIALGYPDVRLFIVVGSDLNGSHFHLFRSNSDNHDKLSGLIKKINNDNELGARCRYSHREIRNDLKPLSSTGCEPRDKTTAHEHVFPPSLCHIEARNGPSPTRT
jgi:hypothetical protein